MFRRACRTIDKGGFSICFAVFGIFTDRVQRVTVGRLTNHSTQPTSAKNVTPDLTSSTQIKKALLVPFDRKKEAQIAEDIALGPRSRFFKMFDLIALSIRFSPNEKRTQPLNEQAIVLTRTHDRTSKAS